MTSVSVRGVKLAADGEGPPRLVAWDAIDFVEEVEDLTALQRFSIMGRGLFHFRSRHSLRQTRSWISLRAEAAFNRTVVVPPVNDEGLDKILEYEAQQQVPYPLEEVYWDRRVIAIREDGEVSATLFAVKRSSVEDRLRKMEKARFPVDGIQLRPIALHNFCAFERLLEPGTIIIDADYSGLQVLIHHDDQTWFRVLPVGGVDFVARLRETFDLKHREAVRMASGRLKIPDKDLFEACRQEVAQDIVDEAVRTVRYYLAATPQVHASGIVLFESHACVPSLSRALKRSLDLPVFRPKGFRELEVDPEVVTAGIQEHFPALAKSVGLALQGVGKAETEVQLFPDDLERDLSGRRVGYLVAAACVLVALIIAGFNRGAEADDVASRRADLERILAEAQQRSAVESELSPSAPFDEVRSLKGPAAGRTGPMPLVAALYGRQAEWDQGPRPQVVAMRYAAGERDAVEVVLAIRMGQRDASGQPVQPDEALDAFAKSLVDGELILECAPEGDRWIAGSLARSAGVVVSEGELLRYRYAHRLYKVKLGGET